jgi:predicted amidohydrolase
LNHISPYLEHSGSGISSLWAQNAALKYDCTVTIGYPESVDITDKWPADPEYYNSAITYNADGEAIINYRKTFLYPTDETWALEGPDGFYDGVMPGLGSVVMGICKWLIELKSS